MQNFYTENYKALMKVKKGLIHDPFVINISVPHKPSYRFNTILIKIPVGFFFFVEIRR